MNTLSDETTVQEEGAKEEVGQEASQEEVKEEGEASDESASLEETESPSPEPQEVESTPEPSVEEPEVSGRIVKDVLRDPRTGEPLRDQDPGVPNSAWVGNHNHYDTDDK